MLQVACKTLGPAQAEQFKKFGAKINRLGANFFVFTSQGEMIKSCESGLFDSNYESLESAACQLVCTSEAQVVALTDGRVLAAALRQSEGHIVCFVDIGPKSFSDGEIKSACMREFLLTLAEDMHYSVKSEAQIEMVSSELAHTYEELVLLYKMSTNMKVTESDSNYLQLACDSLTDLVNVEGIAILIEKYVNGDKRLVLTAGSGLIDIDQKLAYLMFDRLTEEMHAGKDALLDSEVDRPFKFTWPQRIKNIIALPLYGNEKIIGLMVAMNRLDKPDFDSIDVKLFNSVANECAVFIENGKLFTDLKELFVGSLKALTNSIDAKDQYTRGHSERVAFISRWLAEKLSEEEPLDDELIHRIYLGGLLHDIGKIGIDENVLRKNGPLSDDERNQIKAHPLIGSNILSDIKQMADIVPGVLCHHERVDGKGYPNGLTGDKIPLIGKIVMIADSFDAMTSKRVYRNAMDVQKAFDEVEKGLGTQFDERLGRIFIKHGTYELCKILQDGMIEQRKGRYSFSEYGTLAVGSLLK